MCNMVSSVNYIHFNVQIDQKNDIFKNCEKILHRCIELILRSKLI